MMKKLLYLMIIISVSSLTLLSCSKDEGVGGKAKIYGTVKNPDGVVSGAIVNLAFGTTEATTEFDDITITNDDGKYTFEGLNPGNYFVTAEYTNSMGVLFKTGGAVVKIGSKDSELEVNLDLE